MKIKTKDKKGGGPPPLYAEDVEASALAYYPNSDAKAPAGRRFHVPLPQSLWKPYSKHANRLTKEKRALSMVEDNLYRNGGVSRLDNGRFDTENVAFFVTFNPFGRQRNVIYKYPQIFHYENLKNEYPIGSQAHWNTLRRTILVACRGTKDAEDIETDKIAAWNILENRVTRHLHRLFGQNGNINLSHIENLSNSPLYKKIASAVKNAQLSFPISENDYFATGHSLGGALADELVRQQLVQGTVNFNPLISPYDTSNGTADPHKVQRVYTQHDFVKNLLIAATPIDDLQQFDRTVTIIPDVNNAFDIGASHKMHNFQDPLKSNMDLHHLIHLLKLPHGKKGLHA